MFLAATIVFSKPTGSAVNAPLFLPALSDFSSFVPQIDGTVTGLTGLENVISTINDDSILLSSDVTTLNNALATLQADSATTCAYDTTPDADWANIRDNGIALETTATSLGAGVASAATTLGNIVSSGSGEFVVSNLGRNVFVGTAAALGLYMAFLGLIGITLLPRYYCANAFRCCNALLVVVFLLTWIFAGGLLMVSVVGSDMCVDVPSALGAIAGQTAGSTQLDADTLVYYAGCRLPNGTIADPSTDAAGAAFDAATARAAASSLQAAFSTWVGQRTPQWRIDCNADVTVVNNAFTSIDAVTASLAVDASCLTVNNVYQPVAASLCNTGIYAMTNVWVLATVCALIILVMTIAGVRLCWRHPGDPIDVDDGSDSVRLTQRWASAGGGGGYGSKAPPAAPPSSATPAAYVVSNAAYGAAKPNTTAYGAADWGTFRR